MNADGTFFPGFGGGEEVGRGGGGGGGGGGEGWTRSTGDLSREQEIRNNLNALSIIMRRLYTHS